MEMSEDRQPKDGQPAAGLTGSTGEIAPEVSQEELEALLKKVDKESTFRKLAGFDHWLVFWIAVAFSCSACFPPRCSGRSTFPLRSRWFFCSIR